MLRLLPINEAGELLGLAPDATPELARMLDRMGRLFQLVSSLPRAAIDKLMT
jgi:hypothetical protein